ncbi:MAG: Holliday junction resolvase RuvX [Eubacterium sp.]|nr:Holliday junction resolvase RuvX [Eubacterium sp.]
MSIMGLDFGTSTVGVAISDSMLITALPIETITRKGENKLRRTYARIKELIEEYSVDRIVVGEPKNMNGTDSEMSELAGDFAEELEKKTGLPVEMWDERMTTMTAGKVLQAAGIKGANKKKYVDKLAASIILQGYLNYYGQRENNAL